jgi:hypothetical protein
MPCVPEPLRRVDEYADRGASGPGDVAATTRQRHYWGSANWMKGFNRRSRVEGWFGTPKNDSAEGLCRDRG